ncbi:MAG: AMP-binding protein [Roseibium sp.]|uniref:class I adenylate-forming enzyme family protein n=1 Tax=Roseibium sp. TaxID=1936156 RepID=UPI0026354FAD|nr:AMP-binding protein [Roseibium sp.]MCV0429059.1 AMP-binding protein [Roseibium sp.]
MAYIGDKLKDFARTMPEKTALRCGPDIWTWRELIEEVEAAERTISRLSPQGGRVALLLPESAAMLICFFACARTGRIAMVMDPDWPEDQLETVLKAARPDLRIDADSYAPHDSQALPQPDSNYSSGDTAPREGDLFYCGFTSGSTGTPKGYVRDHGSWLRSFELGNREFGIDPADRIVLAGQLTHSLHLYGAVCGLARGQEVSLAARFDPRSILSSLVTAETGAVLYATPTQLHFISEAARRSGPLNNVVRVLASGAKWQDSDRAALEGVFPNADLIEFYGASETSFITLSNSANTVPQGSVGKAPAGVQIAIGDPDAPLPDCEAGEIWVKSTLLFSGYLTGDEPQTRWKNDWLSFGDHGFLDANGYLFLTGRANRMVVTSGLNVYPEEVEAVLMAHPQVAAAVVAGLEDPVRGQRLEAAVQLTEPLAGAEKSLLHHCRTRLASGKVPRRIHFYRELPLTAGGKPDIQRVMADLSGSGPSV